MCQYTNKNCHQNKNKLKEKETKSCKEIRKVGTNEETQQPNPAEATVFKEKMGLITSVRIRILHDYEK